jgi:hypothetical protein
VSGQRLLAANGQILMAAHRARSVRGERLTLGEVEVLESGTVRSVAHFP